MNGISRELKTNMASKRHPRGFSPRNRIRGWTGRLSSWKFRIQAMPDCQEASEIKKNLEILDRHLQLVI